MRFNAKSPGFGSNSVALIDNRSDHAFFSKIALPLGKGVSVGVLLSRETSRLNATEQTNPNQSVRYKTEWRTSGGFGVTWEPTKKLLLGFRGLLNSDLEVRNDPAGVTKGRAHSAEYRLGGSISPWRGGWIDIGGTRLERRNALAATHTVAYHPNLGFDQALRGGRVSLRFGLDETSPTAGFSFKFARYKLDAAYVHNMAQSRVHNLFGTNSNSILLTFTVNYRPAKRKGP